MSEPQGIIAIMTNPQGDIIAAAMDFERQAPGGCKLWEGQRHRAQSMLLRNAVSAYCSDVLASSLSAHLVEQIGDALRQKAGHKITFRAIGYPESVQDAISR